LRLTDLIGGGAADIEIAGLTADSRAVRPGFLFAALAGAKTDGAHFVEEALSRGAVAVLAVPDAGHAARLAQRGVPYIADMQPRARLAQLSARFYPAQPATVVAVTGTNGKTSVASFARQIWSALGHVAASVGTLGVVAPGYEEPLAHTSPDPVTLHRHLDELARRGVTHLAIEASSHGLDQHRIDGVRIAAAAFTNLTRDHLDYHADERAYFAAKLRLFTELLPAGGAAVINADSDHALQVETAARRRGAQVLTSGAQGRDLRLRSLEPHSHGLHVDAEILGRGHAIELPLVGAFQAGNALCALGLALACGADADAAIAALASLEGVPGRMQHVASTATGAPVFVDYAHTPDALETVLAALRPHAAGRLVVVFGCGGDRDRGKRPLMGRIATDLADRVFVTDDNPRTEAPAAIRAEILRAAPGALEMADRADAIAAAVSELGPSDVLVIAGKGHEQGQNVGGVIRPFDDATVAREAAARFGRRNGTH
jgi:UDP-N-acetylmuramoyl-L-alanyl-D-glutamate--2,6-diaminopimelate ligase